MLARAGFRSRLVIGAILWISIGFVVSWVVLVTLLRSHVLAEFASELDHHATELVELAELDAAGDLFIRAPLSDFRFSEKGSGYYWQFTLTQGTTLASSSLGTARLPMVLDPAGSAILNEARVSGPTGETMLLERLVHIGGPSGPMARVAVAMDTSLIAAYFGSLERTLGIAMAVLASGLIVAAFAQIAFAFRPLSRIERALASVKRGEARRMPVDLPSEVMPLVENLNAMLDKNEEMIQRARLEAGNLAHSLKSSLAHLQNEADKLMANSQSGTVIQTHCDAIRRQIDYQLARARAVASRGGGPQATPVGLVIENVIKAVRCLHRDRTVSIEVAPRPSEAKVNCGVEDLEEVLGNLIDNAVKWASSRVLVSAARAQNDKVRICIEDDGPGMPPEAHERVFQPGARLDESTPGTGLGLTIARDVVRLHDGDLWVEKSGLGGARLIVEI